ncbi:MAG: hypothetical protein OEZ68_09290 [Gammaproteobacteria bacterium]|nr:hypothetical protein [Gammaproteobacteria bacterium]MDH5800982.1 hypothetical protein [Gammaproteobacteria bacterium]
MTAKANHSLYFVNKWVDFFCIGGSSFLLFVAFWLFYTDARTPQVITLAIILQWFINWPHFSMSTYRLYQSKANIEQYPVTAYVIPFVVLGGLLLSFAYPTLVAPYFVKLFMLWSPYHYSGQTIGITFLYCMRAGIKLNAFERRVFISFILLSYLLSTVRAEVSRDGYDYYGVKYPSFSVPQWLADTMEVGMWVAMVLFVVAVIFWVRKNKRMIPPIVLLPAVTQYLWFIQAVYMPSFQEFVPLFHSLQYMLIAWGIQLKEKMDLKQIKPSRTYAILETSRWYAINVLGGIALFYLFPKIGGVFGTTTFFAIAVTSAAVQIHHFFVDGVIWKLQNRTVSHPLKMQLTDVTGESGDAKLNPT